MRDRKAPHVSDHHPTQEPRNETFPRLSWGDLLEGIAHDGASDERDALPRGIQE